MTTTIYFDQDTLLSTMQAITPAPLK